MNIFSKQVVGVDIGHASVKVVGLELGRVPRLVGCKEITVDPKYLQKEGFTDPALIGQAIKDALRSAAPRPIKAREAYCNISELQVFRKIMDLPVTAGSNVLENVRLQASQYLPENPESMEMDYIVLNEDIKASKQQIMLVAAPQRILDQYVDVFAEAKLQLKAIEAKPEAVSRATISSNTKDAVAVVDIGSESTTVFLYDQGSIKVTSSFNVGGNVVKDQDTGELLEEDKQKERIRHLAGGICDEIDHVVKFYLNHTQERQKIKEIHLSGGGSMLVGLQEDVQKQVEQKVCFSKSLINLPAFCDRRFIGALGSALFSMGGKVEK